MMSICLSPIRIIVCGSTDFEGDISRGSGEAAKDGRQWLCGVFETFPITSIFLVGSSGFGNWGSTGSSNVSYGAAPVLFELGEVTFI